MVEEGRALKLLLVLENDYFTREDFSGMLRATSFDVELQVAHDPENAFTLMQVTSFDIVVAEMPNNHLTQTAFIRKFVSIDAFTPLVVILADDHTLTGITALKEGAQEFLTRNKCDATLLEKALRSAMARKARTHALVKPQDDYRVLFDLNPMPMWAFDPETLRIVLVNKAASIHYGYSIEEFLQLTLPDLRPSTELQRFNRFLNRHSGDHFLSGNDSWHHKKKDGTVIDVELAVQKVNIHGRFLFLVSINDVTEGKRMSHQLLESQQRLALAMRYGRMVAFDVDYRKNGFYFSNLADTLFGLPIESFKDMTNLLDLVHPEDHDKVAEALQNPRSANKKIQLRLARPDTGETIWVERRCYEVRDERNHIVESRGVLVDITELKESEAHLIRSYNHLEAAASQQTAILNAIPAHIALLNHEGIIIDVNEGWRQFAIKNNLTDPDFCIGKTYFTGNPQDEEITRIYTGITAVINGQATSFETEYPCHAPDEQRWFKLVATRLPVYNGWGAVVMHLDITERRLGEEKLTLSEIRFRTLIENSGDVLILTGVDKVIHYVSPNIRYTFAVDPLALRGVAISKYIHPDDQSGFEEVFSKVIANPGRRFQLVYRIANASREWRWTEGTIINMLKEKGVGAVVSSFRDITERVIIENELIQKKYLLETANQVAKFGYWTYAVGNEGDKVMWSGKMYQIFGLALSHEITLSSFMSYLHPNDAAFVEDKVKEAISTGKNFSCDHRIVKGDGAVCWILQQAEVFLNDHGRPVSIVGVCKDITERKSHEEQIRQGKKNLDALIDNTEDLIWSIDSQYRLVYANEAFRRVAQFDFNCPLTEGDDVLNLATLAAPHKGKNWYDTALGGEKIMFDYSFLRGEKMIYWEVTFNPIWDQDVVIGVSCFMRDVTARKNTEMTIRGFNERYEILLKATNDAVWDYDIIQETIQWNHGITRLFGYPLNEVVNTLGWWTERVYPQDVGYVKASLQHAFIQGDENWSYHYRFKCRDGSYKYTHDRGFVIYENGRPVRMIGAMQDVHELTEYRMSLEKKVQARTRELEEALKKEKELVGMKSRFVSIASHEFRTPLSTIQFAADFLRLYGQQVSEKEYTRKLDTIETQINHMMFLLDDVLTVGKADSGKITVARTPVNIRDLFDQLILNVRRSLKSSHEVELTLQIQDDLFYTDEKLMHNIFSNLLSNAMKFSPGQDKVFLSCVQQHDEYEITVADRGMGINVEDLESIFQPFNRGKNSGAIPGTGLGLTIVKHAVELLDGRIMISASDEFATMFKVYLPFSNRV